MPRSVSPRVFRAILCPVDFSPNSRDALRYAAMLARLTDARLVVVHVTDPLLVAAASSRRAAADVLLATERDLRRFVNQALRTSSPQSDLQVLAIGGKAARAIAATAEQHGCQLIVMGYRGIGRASRLLFGSTTEGVLRLSSVPVVAVPPSGRRRGGLRAG
jgi:nucleotide-binding universal stress UspA family protein